MHAGLAGPQYPEEGGNQLKLSKKDTSLGHTDESVQSHSSEGWPSYV